MRLVLILLLFQGVVCANPSTIASIIVKFNPYLDTKIADKYGIIIDKYSREYGVSWKIVIAIFRQESNFDHKAINWKSRDFGMGQLNFMTIRRRKVDLGALLTDSDYAIKQTFLILKELKERYNTGARGWYRWFTRYNSFTPHFRRKYNKNLERHLTKIEGFLDEQREEDRKRTGSDSGAERRDISGLQKGDVANGAGD